MTDRDTTPTEDEFDLPEADTDPAADSPGPFGVAPVDPLVYTQSQDSPELRASAAYVSDLKRRLAAEVFTAPRPEEPQQRDFERWTPQGEPAAPAPTFRPAAPTPPTPADEPATDFTRIPSALLTFLVRLVLFLIPVAVIGIAILAGLSFGNATR